MILILMLQGEVRCYLGERDPCRIKPLCVTSSVAASV